MKKRVVILILTLVFLAGAMAAAGLPLESRAAAATSKPTETPAVTPGSLPEISPAPEETEPLAGIGGILERLAQDYDPASGAVGAYRWAESVLGQYLADGRDTASARAAGAAYAARYGENAAIIGRVLPFGPDARPVVRVRTGWGSTRILDMLVGEQLPRIC